jgi:chloramphenicol 3-O-phosphotransferase
MKGFKYFLTLAGLVTSLTASTMQGDSDNHGSILAPQFSPHSKTPQGKIIFISGSCSSGKSSIAKIVAQKLDAKIFAFDEYVMPIVLKKFITKHYGRFLAFFISGLVMRNFFTTVNFLSDKRKYAFQIMFLNDLKNGLAAEPTSKMYREVKKTAAQGKNVVVESPIYLWGGINFLSSLNELNDVAVTYVLAYCPWNDLVDRIKQRNTSKNKKGHRELDWALVNYMDTFDISSNYHADNFLEYLNGNDVNNVIAKYAKPKYKKKHMQLLNETQQEAHKKFLPNTNYYIYPRFTYNLLVNTKTYSAEQGAALVLEYITTAQG